MFSAWQPSLAASLIRLGAFPLTLRHPLFHSAHMTRASSRRHQYSLQPTDVHVTADGIIIMFHDPSLERTTDGSGLIKQQPWHDGIEHVRTVAQPQQQLPTFKNVCDLLMQPDNKHVKLNVSAIVSVLSNASRSGLILLTHDCHRLTSSQRTTQTSCFG